MALESLTCCDIPMARANSIEAPCVKNIGLQRRISFGRFLDEDERVSHGPLAAVTRAVHHIAVNPERGGASAVEIERLLAAELDHVSCQLLKAHAYGQLRLPAIDDDEEVELVVPPNGSAGMAYRRRGEIRHLALSHQYRTASDGGSDSMQIGRRSGGDL